MLERLVSLLIDMPRAVRVGEHGGRGTCNFTVRVADEDLGKLIGRQGRTARALRTLLDARGVQDGRRYGLEIRE